MSNVVLTTSGASFMATAGTMFPAIPIRYFLPVYDYRIDPYVLPTSGLTQISAADGVSAVGVFGDIIYNIDSFSTSAYSISNNEFLIYDSNQSGTTTISNNRFNDTSFITLRNGVPLSNSISGTSIVYSYPNWTTTGYTIVSGNNSVPVGYTCATDKFFRVNSFAPISSAAGGLASGLFKIVLSNQRGNFKFNKIALYAAKILSGGIEDTSIPPVLVGIAYLNSPVIKSNDGSNLTFFEADIEIQFSANNYFGNVSYLNNSGFNYVGSLNNLWTDANVILGSSAVPGSWLPRAKLHIVEPNPAVPHLRLTDDNTNHYVDHFFTQESNTTDDYIIQTHRPALHYYVTTSGGSFAQAHTYLDAQGMNRSFLLESDTSVSGLHQTGFTSIFEGYLEKMNIVVTGNVLGTFRSADFLSQYATLVLGSSDNLLGSDNAYEDSSRFLTVHGGATFTSSKGIRVSGTNDYNYPNISACGWITGDTIYGITQVASDGIVGAYKGIKDLDPTNSQSNHFNVLGMTQFYTSADFYIKTKFIQGLSAVGNSQFNNALNVSGSAAIKGNLLTYGTNSFVGTTLFSGVVGFNNTVVGLGAAWTTILATDSILSQANVSANGGFWESSRTARMGSWTSYTPTITVDSGAITAGPTTYIARYMVIGKTLFLDLGITLSVTGTVAMVSITLPDGFVIGYTGDPFVHARTGQFTSGSTYELSLNCDLYGGTSIARYTIIGAGNPSYPVNTSIAISSYFFVETQ